MRPAKPSLAEHFELKGIEDPAGKASELIANDSSARFLSEELDRVTRCSAFGPVQVCWLWL